MSTPKQYGQYNELLKEIRYEIRNDMMTMKFLHYGTDTDVVNEPDLMASHVREIERSQLFSHKKIPKGDAVAKSYISFELDTVLRDDKQTRQRGTLSKYFVECRIAIYLTMHDSLLETKNGNRLAALEQCLQDIFTDAEVGSLFKCRLGNSIPDKTVEGYTSRVIYLYVNDKNSSGTSNMI